MPPINQRDLIQYRQVGPKVYEIYLSWFAGSGGSAGSSDYIFTLPNSLMWDTTREGQEIFSGNQQTNTWATAAYAVPTAGVITNGSQGGQVLVVPFSQTTYRVVVPAVGVAVQAWGGAYFGIAGSTTLSFSLVVQ
jgi:hypothetical protein